MQEGKLDSVAWSTMPACPDLGLWAQVVRVVLASGGGKEGGAPVELIAAREELVARKRLSTGGSP